MSALDKQEGGSHYKDYPIQPVEFITKNKLGFLEGCVIKRVCRWRAKNGIEDLRKAIHELELLIEMEEAAEKRGLQDGLDRIKREHMERDPMGTPLDELCRVPAADESLPRYQVIEGGEWPTAAPNGTIVEAWRPFPGRGYCFQQIGFMWGGELVRDPPAS